jgi:RNA polymerase sigma-70 factor (ECF subfamily)
MLIDEKISDEKLVENIINSDQELYSFVIDRYELKLKSYIKRLTNNSFEVDDLVQQTFVNTFINLKSFDLDQKFSSWIYRIAHNITINWLKKKKINIFFSQDDLLTNSLKADIDIHREFIDKDDLGRVTAVINSLPEKFKEPILLFYVEEKTYDEISEILRKPKNTIGTLISRAKLLLKKQLQ